MMRDDERADTPPVAAQPIKLAVPVDHDIVEIRICAVRKFFIRSKYAVNAVAVNPDYM